MKKERKEKILNVFGGFIGTLMILFIGVLLIAMIEKVQPKSAKAIGEKQLVSIFDTKSLITSTSSQEVLVKVGEESLVSIFYGIEVSKPILATENVLVSIFEENVEIEPEVIATPTATPEPTKHPKKKVSEFSKLKDETYLFAQILECEVGCQGKKDMRCCGSVVLNRVRTDYPDFKDVKTIKEVLYQGYGTRLQQYSEYTIQKIENGIKPSKSALKVAKGLLNGTIECLEESILFQTENEPNWEVEIVKISGTTEVYSMPTDFKKWKKSQKDNKEK